MKTLRKICLGGGVFLLTLSVVLGVCLFTLPTKTNANAAVNATELIDDHEYAVLNVDNTMNIETLSNFIIRDHDYAKLVLQEDYVVNAAKISVGGNGSWGSVRGGMGKWVILDLNGFTIRSDIAGTNFGILAERLEIHDSSPLGTGRIQGTFQTYNREGGNLAVYIYGGTYDRIRLSINEPVTAEQEILLELHDTRVDVGVVATRGENTKVRIYDSVVGNIDPSITDITETFNDILYQRVYLAGDTDPEQSAVIFQGDKAVNYRYILTDDWDLVANNQGSFNGSKVFGNAIIIDFNGHFVNSSDYLNGSHYFYIDCNQLELTDTSVVGGGGCETMSLLGLQTIIVSGKFVGQFSRSSSNEVVPEIIIRSGNVGVAGWYMTRSKITLAPYVVETGVGSGGNLYHYFSTPDYFTLSPSPYVSGQYNYEVSYGWDLDIWALEHLVLTNQTYHLWGRNADGVCKYLNICSVDGQWVKIDPEISVA